MTNIIQTPKQQYLTRLNMFKPFLPKKWRSLFIAQNPQYDTKSGSSKLENCFNGRRDDLIILDFMEKITAQAREEAELLSDCNEYNDSKYDNQ